MKNYFLRAAELRILEVIPADGGIGIERLVALSALSPSQVASVLRGLERRGFVQARDGRYFLSPDGALARQDLTQPGDATSTPIVVFLDESWGDTSDQSLDELSDALDEVLGQQIDPPTEDRA